MTQEKDDLPAQIHEWLRHEGYPFEMQVAQAFRKVGFHVTQSDYYIDPEEQKAREIDVVAVAQRAEKDGPVFRIMFLIECKSSKEKPWLLLSAPEDFPGMVWSEEEVAERIASRMGTQVLSELAQDGKIQYLALFSLRRPVGYGENDA